MAKPRINYTRDSKMSILSQIESGLSIAQVARENGLHPSLVARWKREYLDNPEKAFNSLGHPYKDQARIAEL
jgi:transposase-like protein